MQLNNMRNEDVFVTVFDLNRGDGSPVVDGRQITRGGIFGIPFLNADADGYYQIRWTARNDDNQQVGGGDADSRNGDTVYIR